MQIILKEAYECGTYSPIQSWDNLPIPETHALVPETLDTTVFYEHNGFVFLTIETLDGIDTVTNMTANTEAWEAWKAEHPDPEPIHEATTDELMDVLLGVTE